MPLCFDVEEYLGTNSDGSRSDEFCYYCLKDGKYIVDISMWEMIDIWIKYTDKYNEYADTDYSPKEVFSTDFPQRVFTSELLPTPEEPTNTTVSPFVMDSRNRRIV